MELSLKSSHSSLATASPEKNLIIKLDNLTKVCYTPNIHKNMLQKGEKDRNG